MGRMTRNSLMISAYADSRTVCSSGPHSIVSERREERGQLGSTCVVLSAQRPNRGFPNYNTSKWGLKFNPSWTY